MKRLWFGLLLLAPCGPAAHSLAGEVIATSKARRPVAAAVSPIRAVAYQQPAAELGQPRVVRGASASKSGPAPVKEHEPLMSIPAHRTQSFTPLANISAGSPVMMGQPVLTSFAIERTSALLPEPGLLSVGAVGGNPEQLPMPQSTAKSVVTKFPDMPTLSAGPDVVSTEGMLVVPEEGVATSSPSRFYGSAEYLFWATKQANVPPLVTTAPVLGPEGAPVGDPNTTILFGGDTLDHSPQSGGRIRAGYWFDYGGKPIAVEASYFRLGEANDNFSASSPNPGLIARPFFNLNRNVESSQLVAIFNQQLGRIDVDAPSRLQGADLNLRCKLCCGDTCQGNYRVDLFGGFRWLQLDESITITEQGVVVNIPGIPPNQAFLIQDSFATKNNFYGGQVGLVGEFKRGKWSVEGRGSVALGVTHQTVDINGFAIFQNPGQAPTTSTGGLLALSSNIGHYSRNKFAVVPELGVKLGYQVTERFKATVGYNFLFWSNVVRPGDQIDRGLDTRLIPNFIPPGVVVPAPVRPGPVFAFKDSTYWAQGLTLGLEFNY